MKWYAKRDHGKKGKTYAHREIWEAAYGPIPAGMIIHHRDEDRRNNALENLACMTRLEHQRLHLGCQHGQAYRNASGKCKECRTIAQRAYVARQAS
jgi:hypothetical protein